MLYCDSCFVKPLKILLMVRILGVEPSIETMVASWWSQSFVTCSPFS